MTNDAYNTILIVGSVCGFLLLILICVVICTCIRCGYCNRRLNSESRTVRQNTENWNESMAMSQNVQNENQNGIEMAERNERTGNIEEVFQIQYETPALEPSAPPLPPEYYIEYT